MEKVVTAQVERLAFSVAEARAATGLGITNLYQLMADGTLPFRKVGKRRLIPADALRRLVGSEAA